MPSNSKIFTIVIFKSILDFREKTVIIIRMKRLLSLLLIVFCLPVTEVFAEEQLNDIQIGFRDFTPIELNAGTFIPVINAQEISTQYCTEGYRVRFIGITDLFMHNTKVIPENTLFEGYIEKMHEPVVGTNASMVIRIAKAILPDGFEFPMKAYIYTSNNNIIGGGISAPEKWEKIPHYQHRLKGTASIQLRPSMNRKMGEHTTLQSGLDLIIILTEPLEITHILTD